ncbi:MAG: HAD family hydrolase [Bacillota bacterium]
MVIKEVILDADGPIILSPATDIGNFQIAAEMNQLQRPTSSFLKKIWGRDLEAEILPELRFRMLWSERQAETVLKTYQRLSDEAVYPILSGLRKTLETLSCSCSLGLISGRDLDSLERRMVEAGLNLKIFRHVELMEKKICHKPDPQVLTGFWRDGFDPIHTVYVGDSVDYDYRVAIANEPRLPFIAVRTGLSDFSDFCLAGIELKHILKKTTELPSVIGRL